MIPPKNNLLELIKSLKPVRNSLSCRREYQHKNQVFPYTNNEQSEKEIKKTIPSKRTKFLGAKWAKELKDVYIETSKMLLKVIKQDMSKCSWIGSLNCKGISIT